MYIAQITPGLTRAAGGPFESVRRLSQCLKEAGANVSVHGLDAPHIEYDLPAWDPLRPIVYSRRFPYFAGYAPDMVNGLLREDSQVLHSHGLWMYTSLAVEKASRKMNIPYIVSPRGMLEPWAWKHHAWKKRPVWWLWERRIISRAAVLHATAESEADNLRALGLHNPIAVIPNGVDIPNSVEQTEEKKDKKTVLFISRIHPKKGLLNLVKAWTAVKPVEWKAVIAGPSQGGHEDEVKDAVRSAGLSDQFEFPGPVYEGDKWELYRKADLFILPTYSENFGIVVAEALAAGVPVITTKGTPWRELEEQECGWGVDIGVEPLAAAFKQAMALSDDARREMGLRGRQLVQEKYSWPKIAQDMLSVYTWILGSGRRPDFIYNL